MKQHAPVPDGSSPLHALTLRQGIGNAVQQTDALGAPVVAAALTPPLVGVGEQAATCQPDWDQHQGMQLEAELLYQASLLDVHTVESHIREMEEDAGFHSGICSQCHERTNTLQCPSCLKHSCDLCRWHVTPFFVVCEGCRHECLGVLTADIAERAARQLDVDIAEVWQCRLCFAVDGCHNAHQAQCPHCYMDLCFGCVHKHVPNCASLRLDVTNQHLDTLHPQQTPPGTPDDLMPVALQHFANHDQEHLRQALDSSAAANPEAADRAWSFSGSLPNAGDQHPKFT